MQEIWQEINQTQNQLDQCLKTLRKNGEAFAKAERDYKIRLRQEVLKLRDEGQAVTIIPYIAYGQEEVARLRFERDIAEAMYKANLEALGVKKLEMNILKTQYEKEYSNVR